MILTENNSNSKYYITQKSKFFCVYLDHSINRPLCIIGVIHKRAFIYKDHSFKRRSFILLITCSYDLLYQ